MLISLRWDLVRLLIYGNMRIGPSTCNSVPLMIQIFHQRRSFYFVAKVVDMRRPNSVQMVILSLEKLGLLKIY